MQNKLSLISLVTAFLIGIAPTASADRCHAVVNYGCHKGITVADHVGNQVTLLGHLYLDYSDHPYFTCVKSSQYPLTVAKADDSHKTLVIQKDDSYDIHCSGHRFWMVTNHLPSINCTERDTLDNDYNCICNPVGKNPDTCVSF